MERSSGTGGANSVSEIRARFELVDKNIEKNGATVDKNGRENSELGRSPEFDGMRTNARSPRVPEGFTHRQGQQEPRDSLAKNWSHHEHMPSVLGANGGERKVQPGSDNNISPSVPVESRYVGIYGALPPPPLDMAALPPRNQKKPDENYAALPVFLGKIDGGISSTTIQSDLENYHDEPKELSLENVVEVKEKADAASCVTETPQPSIAFDGSKLKAVFVIFNGDHSKNDSVAYSVECKIRKSRDNSKIAVFDSKFLKVPKGVGALPPATGARSIAMLKDALVKQGVTRICYENPTDRMRESVLRGAGSDFKRENKNVSFSIDSLEEVVAWTIAHPNWGPEYIAR